MRVLLTALAIASSVATLGAQSLTYSTLVRSRLSLDGIGSAARFWWMTAGTSDASGNLYVLDQGGQSLRKITPAGVVSTLLSREASFYPITMAAGSGGDLYFVNMTSATVRKRAADGTFTTVYTSDPSGNGPFLIQRSQLALDAAGNIYATEGIALYRLTAPNTSVVITGRRPSDNTSSGYVDGPAGTARFNNLGALVIDSGGVLYGVDQSGTVIRRVGTDAVTTTLAGTAGTHGTADGTGAAAQFTGLSALYCDAAGTLYAGDGSAVRKITAAGVVTTLVPGGTIGSVTSLTGDAGGNLFVFDGALSAVWKVAPDGTVTLFAGSPATFTSGSGGATLQTPAGIAVDVDGGVLISDAADHTIKRYAGSLVTIAGRSATAGSADGGGTVTGHVRGGGLVRDASGDIFFSDGEASTIRRFASDGMLTTFAGRAGARAAADGSGGNARFNGPDAMIRDGAGNLIVMDSQNCAIRKVTPAAVVTTIAGRLGSCGNVDGDAATARIGHGGGLALDGSGALLIADSDYRSIRRVAPDGTVTTLGTGLVDVRAIAVDSAGNIYANGRWALKKITPGGVVTTIAGSENVFGAADGPAASATFGWMAALLFGPDGTLYIADYFGTGRLRQLSPDGIVTTIAGGGTPLSLGGEIVDGTGTNARFSSIRGLAREADGTFYVTDFRTIRRVSAAGVVETLTGDQYDSGAADGAGRAEGRLNSPHGIAAAADGSIYLADTGNHTIRRLVNNQLTTFAGAAGSAGGADGQGASARFNSPVGIALTSGNLLVADTGNHTIRLISSSGAVSTLAGQAGVAGSSDGAGASATFNSPRGVAVDAGGTIYVADTGNHVIRAISASGTVTTLAGTVGASGSADGTGSAARFNAPVGVTVVGSTIFVDDTGNHTIRAVTTGGAVSTVGGAAGSPALADGAAATARFNAPAAIGTDTAGTLYIADTGNGAIRFAVMGTATAPVITVQPQSRSAAVHGTVQFTCAATGTPAPTYAWQRADGAYTGSRLAPISGANTRTLTISDVGRADDGSRVTCIATNSAGTATSSAATLSVGVLKAAPGRLVFSGMAVPGGGYSAITSPTPVRISSGGAGAIAWTAAADKPWIQIAGASGTGDGRFTVSASDPGFYISAFGTIRLDAGDPEIDLTVPVTLNSIATDSPPTGVIDTPASNATGLSGSLAVTGWAVDDIEMDHVELWRDPVAGETTPVYGGSGPGNGKIFIATATFVPGARPDVEALYGGWRPGAYSAGWGYMLLTQGLWNQGNGTYTLYAFALDKAGKVSTLGTKTITVDNANATKPFGTIDTPSYGGTVSGMIQNFGWALTPGATCSIANPNVQVSIDSGALTPVVYGDVRSDIAGAFPTYTNAAAAGGHYTLDTTTLTNGMHTIGWFVTDSCGRSDGIGSRFFTVANASSLATTAPAAIAVRAPRDWSLVRGTTAVDAPPAMADGTRVVRVDQAERIELQLPGTAPYAVAQASLPIGSSFDAGEGTFYWQPAAGFLGAYDLAFTAGTRTERVRVVVGPPIRMVIDTPGAGNVLASSGFTIAGWAVDLASLDGAGIDTLHVWAYPVGGGAPQFVGVGATRGARPDVARLYGSSFTDAGFSVTGTLPPGTYDLVVFARSAGANTFAGAETVRVVVR